MSVHESRNLIAIIHAVECVFSPYFPTLLFSSLLLLCSVRRLSFSVVIAIINWHWEYFGIADSIGASRWWWPFVVDATPLHSTKSHEMINVSKLYFRFIDTAVDANGPNAIFPSYGIPFHLWIQYYFSSFTSCRNVFGSLPVVYVMH